MATLKEKFLFIVKIAFYSLSNWFQIKLCGISGGEINGGFIGDSQSLAGSRKSLNMLHGQPVVMMPHPSAGGGHPVGPGFPPPPPPFMQVC